MPATQSQDKTVSTKVFESEQTEETTANGAVLCVTCEIVVRALDSEHE